MTRPRVGRRALIAVGAACFSTRISRAAPAVAPLRLGILQFGTVQWVADIIRRHGLDTRYGFDLQTVTLANTDAGRVSLMAGGSDVVVSDWPFVAVQRSSGTNLSFAAFSSASGGIMTRSDSPVRALADLRGRKLGVAGGPVDKSWLLVQAACRAKQGIDLAAEAQVVYGAPPLLGAKLAQGELDAVLTFWNFTAKLEATGMREAVSVAQCAEVLGLAPPVSLVGFVFREEWGRASPRVIDGFLGAVREAEEMLAKSDAEWQAIRPLMDAADDAVFARLRERFLAGIAHADVPTQEQQAGRLFAIMRETGGARATGGIDALPPGIFWLAHDPAS